MIGSIFFGLVVGALARLVVPGRQRLGLVLTLVLGLVGSLIGGSIANLLGTGSIWELDLIGTIAAVGSAVLLIGVFEGAAGRRR